MKNTVESTETTKQDVAKRPDTAVALRQFVQYLSQEEQSPERDSKIADINDLIGKLKKMTPKQREFMGEAMLMLLRSAK